MRRNKTIVMIAMCVAMLFMAVGYALLSTRLDIGGSTAVTSSWRVEFSAIKTVELKGGATNKITPTASGTTAKFEVDLVMPGDEVVYEIDITNYGDIVAEVKSATYTGTGTDAIYVNVEGVRKGTIIQSCEGLTTCPKATLILKIGYDETYTEIPEYKTKEISITLNVGQYVPGSPVEDGLLIPELAGVSLSKKILSSNKVQSDSGINFGSTTSGYSGLYYTNNNTEDNKTSYYFRGNVENNYVKFGKDNGNDIIWRIVRINEDGSVRLITDTSVGNSQYSSYDHMSVGYMYSSTNVYTNETDSVIKDYLDSWYINRTNLNNYSSLMSNSAGFCNDRNSSTRYSDYFASNDRISLNQPQFACPNEERDLFTLASSGIGNEKLTYPVGLLTIDEAMYAGAVTESSSFNGYTKNYYLINGSYWFTMSPFNYEMVYFVGGNGDIAPSYDTVDFSFAVRPVINVNSNARVLSGDGSSGTPYVIG